MPSPKTAKVWKALPEAPSGVQVTEEYSALVGNKEHFVLSDNRGNYLHGPTTIIADAANRRVGGLWTEGNDFMAMLPSTITTPGPRQLPFPPMFIFSQLASDLAYFMAFLA